MERKYVKSLLLGIAGGLAAIVVLALQKAVEVLIIPWVNGRIAGNPYEYSADGALVGDIIIVLHYATQFGLICLVLLIAGGLSVRIASNEPKSHYDPLIISGIAGTATTVIWVASNLVIALVSMSIDYLTHQEIYSMVPAEYINLGLGIGGQLCLCSPVYLLSGIFVGLLGGILGYILTGKGKPARS